MIGDIVKVTVDRPLESYHPEHKDMFIQSTMDMLRGLLHQMMKSRMRIYWVSMQL